MVSLEIMPEASSMFRVRIHLVNLKKKANIWIGPLHKRNWSLTNGACLNDDAYSILAFDVKVEDDAISLLLPESEVLDAVMGTSKWIVRQATAEMYDRSAGEGGIEVVGPSDAMNAGGTHEAGGAVPAGSVCGNSSLEW
jgi:nitrite reductase (NAD(P)H)